MKVDFAPKAFILAGLLTGGAAGQETAVWPGIVRGTLVQAEGGVVQVKPATGSVVRCGFDSHTWIEQDRKRLSVASLEPGVSVEALTDMRAGRCYTRTIRLVPPGTAATPSPRRSSMTPLRSAVENIFPRGNLTFGGVVIRRSPTMLVLRTRTEPEKLVRLRDDTRFLDSGSPASAEDVAVNTRVFVRAGKNFENDVEAYQVIWGEMAGPKNSTSP